ncbi:SDR family NAD(P)-dependent oxidoreductase [Massilia sp. W12]|uniref:type I polyketide synthase n=1 Tax=Massilia sp. W12 TaxID=3126507 RepID=UPI0030D1331C
MSSIKKYILEQVAKRNLTQDEAKKLLTELSNSKDSEPGAPKNNDIAIIGMAGRFPRSADAEQFWQVLRNGLNCIRPFPKQRAADFEHILRNPSYTEFLIGDAIPEEDIPHAHAAAGYLDEIDKFDAQFFGIPPTEATFMDPHQRVALELAWETMENAGYGAQRLYGSNTGVYLGRENTNYSLYRYTTENNPMKLTGSWESIMVSRISFLFDFKGPCMIVDTACSAGLVSVHMAAQAILNGECDTALAGGINLIITGEMNPRFQGSMSMDAVESKDSTIRTFDARANGTVWGEGVAMVMLKPLAKAIADRDPIHAIIKGSAINNDGAASGLTAPDPEAQEAVIVKAWQKAGIDPATLSYVEAHGTGTVLGDPIEFKGLSAAFRRFTPKRQFCAIGSLKTNMGHLVAASGVASLFKVVKSLQHREMAPTINFEQPNPYINFLSSPLYVNDILRPWPAPEGHGRRAALSSFGFSHTNCHMVLEEAPPRAELAPGKPFYCCTLSGQTREVLLDYVARLQRYLQEQDFAGQLPALADLCHTLNLGRGHYSHRLALVAANLDELRAQLTQAPALISDGVSVAGGFYQSHQMVSDKKKQLAAGELSDKGKKELNGQAAQAVAAWLAAPDRTGLEQLAALHVAGADLPWASLYAGEARNWLALPTYPFQRIRVWAGPKVSQVTSQEKLHPLLERKSTQEGGREVFSSRFGANSHWVLADHKIKGVCVVPGTTYLEMARAAARLSQHTTDWIGVELRDVFFLQPMIVEADAQRDVRLSLQPDGGILRFTIESAAPGGKEWQGHVEGKIAACGASQATAPDIAALKAQAHESIETFEAETDTGVFQFGPHWDAVRSAWLIGPDALAKLALPPQLAHEVATFQLHPSVMDNAMNLLSQNSGVTYLPFSYKSLKIYAPFSAPMYSHVQARRLPEGQTPGTAETMSYDVLLFGADGQIIAEVGDYVVKKVNSFAGLGGKAEPGADGEYLAMRWQPVTLPEADAAPQRLLLLAGPDSRAEVWRQALQDCGVECRVMYLNGAGAPSVSADADGMRQLCQGDMLQGTQGIVLLPAIAGSNLLQADAASFAAQRGASVDLLLHLVQALLAAKTALPWGLGVASAAGEAMGAAAAMLGVCAGMEYSKLPCRLLDYDAASTPAQSAATLLSIPPGKLFALREGRCLQREMYPLSLAEPQAAAPVVQENGVYLITGGLGGLGLACAAYLAQQARCKIVLLGRSQVAPQTEWESRAASEPKYAQLVKLAQDCAALECLACDIADGAALRAALDGVRQRHGALKGIMHLAGVAGEGFILRKDYARFDAVLRPKLQGLHNLQQASAADPLDWLLCFSSITALTGGEGQSDYAAANAFMDAYCALAQQAGRPLMALNWPSWKEIGMAVDFAVDESNSPFAALAPEHAFARLSRILQHAQNGRREALLPSSINPAGIAPFVSELPFVLAPELQRRLSDSGGATEMNADNIQIVLRGKNEEDVSATELKLAKIYAVVLGLTEIDVFTNFHDMGGNSIIATHLLKLIDSHFPQMVDISDIFSYASIDEMAAYVEEKLARLQPAAAQPAATEQAPQLSDMLDQALEGDEGLESFLDKF